MPPRGELVARALISALVGRGVLTRADATIAASVASVNNPSAVGLLPKRSDPTAPSVSSIWQQLGAASHYTRAPGCISAARFAEGASQRHTVEPARFVLVKSREVSCLLISK